MAERELSPPQAGTPAELLPRPAGLFARLGPRAHPRLFSDHDVLRTNSGSYGVFVWARSALSGPFRRFPSRAVAETGAGVEGSLRAAAGRAPLAGRLQRARDASAREVQYHLYRAKIIWLRVRMGPERVVYHVYEVAWAPLNYAI